MEIKKIIKKFIPKVGLKNEINRENWLKQKLLLLPDDLKILDAGAGTQQHRLYCEHLRYFSQDFAEYDGRGDDSGLQMGADNFSYGKLDYVSDISKIPVESNSFDAVMCTEVFEHLPNPLLAIEEFSRILNKDGYLIITAPFCSLTHFAPYHYSTGFNRYWYSEHLSNYGFDIVELMPNGNYFEYLGQEIYRISSISKKYINKGPRLYEFLGMYLVQRMLNRISKRDKKSSELLCFGYHVLARKR